MCEILNVHVQKVDNGMGSIPVSRSHEKKNDTKSVSFFFSSPARARKFDVYAPLRSALLSNKFCVSQYLCLIVQWVT